MYRTFTIHHNTILIFIILHKQETWSCYSFKQVISPMRYILNSFKKKCMIFLAHFPSTFKEIMKSVTILVSFGCNLACLLWGKFWNFQRFHVKPDLQELYPPKNSKAWVFGASNFFPSLENTAAVCRASYKSVGYVNWKKNKEEGIKSDAYSFCEFELLILSPWVFGLLLHCKDLRSAGVHL